MIRPTRQITQGLNQERQAALPVQNTADLGITLFRVDFCFDKTTNIN